MARMLIDAHLKVHRHAAAGRIVLTRFGELVMRGGAAAVGVVYIRLRGRCWGAVLVTDNRREFERVPSLMVTDWGAGG